MGAALPPDGAVIGGDDALTAVLKDIDERYQRLAGIVCLGEKDITQKIGQLDGRFNLVLHCVFADRIRIIGVSNCDFCNIFRRRNTE